MTNICINQSNLDNVLRLAAPRFVELSAQRLVVVGLGETSYLLLQGEATQRWKEGGRERGKR